MRLLILTFYTLLLILMIVGCISKPGLKTNAQNQHTFQNSQADTSVVEQTDALAGDTLNPELAKRKLIHRCEIWKVTSQPGKMAIFVCVDRTGNVISAQFDPYKSSHSHIKFAKQAEECAKQYVFEEDLTAPDQQCGQMTFIFR